ncbi:cytochrome C oxidase assembly protein [Oleiphilus sp. HI0071]|jgi:cytochrome c oxidase assembly protein subunit 11|uniref:cytochrome c oxidase assembly protein n=1 Tax=unclassified Oleiphilus TaxID=2631174 RepID=UPI0007C2097E|nr:MULTISPECIES: cytochrome c oxidase assembly protein [unclassified Oleiphilus]KZY61745.1 cytochrome C oxidase assembly protein [Oleiphilus sp. HI0065]KZY81788.1 cytochrome C oxidase assembly protein [Oleiphilus sp. HI0071]KZZ06351.1 cytochrome C oxidase assembly protein [Oleiphilus sp. HI0073]KZZ42901.1 cytochrome C oxidase assembly protein [Oleiphilus sp. HI0118]KZZ53690.1 cytochrome C oxidase assembly protein [Oleiphilus sp. HI0122]KZZ70822.1 cytochrome C oxidase assembly protein [Oleiphi
MQNQATKRTVLKSLFAVVAMFGFGFAMVPLYDVFCDITGLNGKTSGRYDASLVEEHIVDAERQVRVQFVTQNNENMPWEFRPVDYQVSVHPGAMIAVDFYAKNPTSKPMVAQAVPSLSPSEGTDFFHKTECFCFNRQVLKPGEEVLMPLRFVVDESLPEHLGTLTLSYTLFDQTETLAPEDLEQALQQAAL